MEGILQDGQRGFNQRDMTVAAIRVVTTQQTVAEISGSPYDHKQVAGKNRRFNILYNIIRSIIRLPPPIYV